MTEDEPERVHVDGGAGSPTDAAVSDEARLWAMGAHLSGAFVSFVGPLVVRLVRGGRAGSWERASVGEALAYQVVVFVAWLVTLPFLWIPCVGFVPYGLVVAVNAVLCIIAGIHAYDSKTFRYPVGWRRSPRPVA